MTIKWEEITNDHINMIPLKLLIKNSGRTDLTKAIVMDIIYSMYDQKYHAVNDIPLDVLNSCLQKMNISETFQMA